MPSTATASNLLSFFNPTNPEITAAIDDGTGSIIQARSANITDAIPNPSKLPSVIGMFLVDVLKRSLVPSLYLNIKTSSL